MQRISTGLSPPACVCRSRCCGKVSPAPHTAREACSSPQSSRRDAPQPAGSPSHLSSPRARALHYIWDRPVKPADPGMSLPHPGLSQTVLTSQGPRRKCAFRPSTSWAPLPSRPWTTASAPRAVSGLSGTMKTFRVKLPEKYETTHKPYSPLPRPVKQLSPKWPH